MDNQTAALFLLILMFWIVLNRWILPRFGINTCMSCGCSPDRERPSQNRAGGDSTGDES